MNTCGDSSIQVTSMQCCIESCVCIGTYMYIQVHYMYIEVHVQAGAFIVAFSYLGYDTG